MSLKLMFTKVVKKYDFLNHILTWGFDKIWRKACAKECATGAVIVDICCGTADLALNTSKYVSPETYILGLDFSKAMLTKAKSKKHVEIQKMHQASNKQDNERTGLKNLSFINADVAYLPFKTESIDRICSSFSFRNLTYKNLKAKTYLREILRTLRFQGKLVFVETSQPRFPPLRFLYHLYLSKVVPLVGWLISGNRSAYRYLGTSATNFPPAEEIVSMLTSVGFKRAKFKRVTFGVAAIHTALK